MPHHTPRPHLPGWTAPTPQFYPRHRRQRRLRPGLVPPYLRADPPTRRARQFRHIPPIRRRSDRVRWLGRAGEGVGHEDGPVGPGTESTRGSGLAGRVRVGGGGRHGEPWREDDHGGVEL